jgi:hypothetical protein
MLVTCRLAGDADRNEYDEKRRACVGHGEFLLAHVGDIDAEFFAQLSARGIGVRFSRLTFAAREFPQATVSFLQRPLTDEEFIATRNDGGDDANKLARHYACPRSTLNSPNSFGGSGTPNVQVMFMGRSPVMSSAVTIRTGPHARYGSDVRTRTKSWNVQPFDLLSR